MRYDLTARCKDCETPLITEEPACEGQCLECWLKETEPMLDHTEIMRECVSIRRGEHPAWQGDATRNGEAFLARISRDMPEEATALAEDLERNVSDFSEELGIHPNTVRLYALILRNNILEDEPTDDRPDGSEPCQEGCDGSGHTGACW